MEQTESSHYPEKHAEDSSHNRTSEIKTELNSPPPEDTNALERTTTIEHYQQDKTAVKRPTSGAIELKIPPHLSIQENGKSSVKNSGIQEDTSVEQVWTFTTEHYQQDKTAVKRPISGSTELEIPLSIQENRDGTRSVQIWPQASEDIPKHKDNGVESYLDTARIQKDKLKFEEHNLKDKKECGASDVQLVYPVTNKKSLCAPRPFDKISTLFEYTQNEILPPETGPSNLIDPVHEYKLLVCTENVSEKDILKKFTDEVFWFAAGCLNCRTNGTIHFGVGDEPLYSHGQIIGLELRSPKSFIDAFDTGLKEHFKGHTSTVRTCIRPPKFFKVKCPDNIKVDKWVIEVDIVPMYELTLEKLFYTTIDKKGRKSKCFFIRLGANTTNHIPEKDPRTVKQNMKTLNNDVKLWALCRKIAEKGL